MNNELLRWWLNVDAIPKGDEPLRLSWEHPWPPWLWTLAILGAAFVAAWSYHNLVGRRGGRGVLAAARFLLIVLALVLVSGPMLELPRETVEQDWVLMLVDRSASMTIADAPAPGGGAAPRRTRESQLRAALAKNAPALRGLERSRQVVWLGFHVGAFSLQGDQPPANAPRPPRSSGPGPASADADDTTIPVALGAPDGRRTNLGAALEQAVRRAAARPLSGIVIFSDGRSETTPAPALVQRLHMEGVRLFAVPLGSAEPLGDLAIRRVDAPRRAFVRDKVPVLVEVERVGAAARRMPGVVRLIDRATGAELDRADLPEGEGPQQVTLTALPELAGEASWEVVVDAPRGGDAAQPAAPDLVPDNNVRQLALELVDRPLRVLFIEGYPRWEYRYVKNLLVREKSIESSVMLISADRDFAQEGNQPISRLPRTAEEFASFDVMILGDVPASFFSPAQLEMMRGVVSERGAGLLWIAGERFTPQSYTGTALSDLLPMRGPLKLQPIGVPVTMTPTPLAERLGVLRLSLQDESGWPRELSDPATGWSQLHYAQRIDPGQLKPAAEVLAQTAAGFGGSEGGGAGGAARDPARSGAGSAPAGQGLPLVISMRYGAGLTIYVATDDIWRWRYGRGESLPEQFWVQMVRMLGRESLAGAGLPAALEAAPRRVAINLPVRVELRLLDAQLIKNARPSVRVVIERDPANAGGAADRVAELDLQRLDGADNRYAATFLPDTPGQLRLRVDDRAAPSPGGAGMEPGPLAHLDLQAAVEVFAPDDELRRPETDHELLASLASATEGRVLQPQELGELPALLPNREVRTINPLTEPIWDSPLALAIALVLLTGEWIGRKLLRLV